MNRIAAIHTGRRLPPARDPAGRLCSFVEDFNWPANPGAPRKPARPTELWVPGRNGQWQGEPATLQ